MGLAAYYTGGTGLSYREGGYAQGGATIGYEFYGVVFALIIKALL